MPPWRTAVLMRPASSPLSLAMMVRASAADCCCWASKSGGTYSASITGVVGSTLSSRTDPPDAFASETAVSIAAFARSVSARSTGTRICLNIVLPLRMPPKCLRELIRFRRDRARGDVTVEPAGTAVDAAPAVGREIDHRERAGREFLPQPLAQRDIARRDEKLGGLLQ